MFFSGTVVLFCIGLLAISLNIFIHINDIYRRYIQRVLYEDAKPEQLMGKLAQMINKIRYDNSRYKCEFDNICEAVKEYNADEKV